MFNRSVVIALVAALAGLFCSETANAGGLGYSRGLGSVLERIKFDQPAIGPFAHMRFCVEYPQDCQVHRMAFRGGKLALTAQRAAALQAINTQVNRSIRAQPSLDGAATEKWLIAPKSGNCHDYAVTKRHELLARGFPSRSVLLAEVVIASGEHHLVVVVRSQDGDLVLDNLNANIRPWSKTQYQWVRIQSPMNPIAWSTVAKVTGA